MNKVIHRHLTKENNQCQKNTWKHVQHHQSLGKCKCKLRDIMTHLSECLQFKKTATTPNCGKDAEKLDTGGNVKWYHPVTQQWHSWRFIPEKWNLTFVQKAIYNLHSSCIYNNQNPKTTHKSFKGWMDLQRYTHAAGEWLVGFRDGDHGVWLRDTNMRTPDVANGPYLDFIKSTS